MPLRWTALPRCFSFYASLPLRRGWIETTWDTIVFTEPPCRGTDSSCHIGDTWRQTLEPRGTRAVREKSRNSKMLNNTLFRILHLR